MFIDDSWCDILCLNVLINILQFTVKMDVKSCFFAILLATLTSGGDSSEHSGIYRQLPERAFDNAGKRGTQPVDFRRAG